MADRIALGQNRPLTLLAAFTGESGEDQGRDGLSPTSPTATYISGGDQHLRDNVGGEFCLSIGTNQQAFLPLGGKIVRELVIAFPLWGNGRWAIGTVRAGNEFQCGLRIENGNAPKLCRGAFPGTVLETGTTGYVADRVYSWSTLQVFTDNVAGRLVWRVHSYANIVLEHEGDTQGSAVYNGMDAVYFECVGVGLQQFDDVLVYVRTLYYTGGAGAIPVAGQTITDTVTGATATVDFVEGTNVAGVIVVHTVSDGAGFGATNEVENGVGWTADASNNLANNKAGLWIHEGFGMAGLLDSDEDINWSGVTGGGTHFSQLNDWTTTTTFVSSDAAGQLDQYGTATPVGIPAGTPVLGIVLSVFAQNNSSPDVSQLQLGYNDGVGNSDGPVQVMPSNYARVDTIWTANARTGLPFDYDAEITAFEVRATTVT